VRVVTRASGSQPGGYTFLHCRCMHPQTRDAGAARCWTWHKGRKRERRRPPRSPPRVRVGMSRPQIARDTNRDGSLCDGLPAPAPESVGAGRPYPPTTARRTPGSTARPAPTWFRTSPPTAPLSHITLERWFGTRCSGQAWYVTRPTRMGHSRSRLQGGSPTLIEPPPAHVRAGGGCARTPDSGHGPSPPREPRATPERTASTVPLTGAVIKHRGVPVARNPPISSAPRRSGTPPVRRPVGRLRRKTEPSSRHFPPTLRRTHRPSRPAARTRADRRPGVPWRGMCRLYCATFR
jgi:hypothetical protein